MMSKIVCVALIAVLVCVSFTDAVDTRPRRRTQSRSSSGSSVSGSTAGSVSASASGSSSVVTGSGSAALSFDLNQVANQDAHKTAKYRDASAKPQSTYMILRRHQAFTIKSVNGPANPAWKFQLELIEEKMYGANKTADKFASSGKYATLTATVAGADITLTHNEGQVGAFRLVVKDGDKVISVLPKVFVFLFNPYVAVDQVFVRPERQAQAGAGGPSVAEHVENEAGSVWQGSAASPNWIPWAFNQYDEIVLLTAIEMLDGLTMVQRSQAHLVTRWQTYQTGNVLHGRWDGDYKDGKEPWSWVSSTEIVGQHQKTNRSPVKYGQCWVFACLLTSLSRSLGIPSRPVTNFDSAHERRDKKTGRFNQICNMHFKVKTDGSTESASELNNASVWNFHVWTEAEMTRPDLDDKNYGGWQAYDATPQEASRDGPKERPFSDDKAPYMCGPAPLTAMKALVYKQPTIDPKLYDIGFIGGETNCLVNYLREEPAGSGKYVVSRTYTNYIGLKTFTKSPDSVCNGERMVNNKYASVCVTNVAGLYAPRKGASSFLEQAAIISGGYSMLEVENPSSSSQQQQEQASAGQRFLPDTKQRNVQQVAKNEKTTPEAEQLVAQKTKTPFSTFFEPRYRDDIRLGRPFKMFLTPLAALRKSNATIAEWSITVDAVSYRGDFISRVKHVAAKSQPATQKPLELHFDMATWKSPELLSALKKTQYLRITMSAQPADKAAQPFLFSKIFAIKVPQLRVSCGKLDRKVGETIDCVVTLNNPLGLKLTNARVKLIMSGTSAQKEQEAIQAQKALQSQETQTLAQASQSGSAALSQSVSQFADEWFSQKSNEQLSNSVDTQSKVQLTNGSQQPQQQASADLVAVTEEIKRSLGAQATVHVFKNLKVQAAGAAGKQSIMATLTSEELNNLRGQVDITLKL